MRPEVVVGQKLWYVPSRRGGEATEVFVEKVGRKWITVSSNPGRKWSEERIDKENWAADGGAYISPGTCYLSKEEYEAEVLLRSLWSDFVSRLTSYWPPKGVTTERIRELAKEFDIPLGVK